MRNHLIAGIDTECGVIITGDCIQLKDNFLKVHYRFVQVVIVLTRGQATLDKIWINMNDFYCTPVNISEFGTSALYMVLWKPGGISPAIRHNVTRVTVKCMRVVYRQAIDTIFRMPIYPMLKRWNANPMTPNPGL